MREWGNEGVGEIISIPTRPYGIGLMWQYNDEIIKLLYTCDDKNIIKVVPLSILACRTRDQIAPEAMM